MDVPFDSEDEGLQVGGILTAPLRVLQHLIDQLEALWEVLPEEQDMRKPVQFLFGVDRCVVHGHRILGDKARGD